MIAPSGSLDAQCDEEQVRATTYSIIHVSKSVFRARAVQQFYVGGSSAEASWDPLAGQDRQACETGYHWTAGLEGCDLSWSRIDQSSATVAVAIVSGRRR
jgi:hypothetical protein